MNNSNTAYRLAKVEALSLVLKGVCAVLAPDQKDTLASLLQSFSDDVKSIPVESGSLADARDQVPDILQEFIEVLSARPSGGH